MNQSWPFSARFGLILLTICLLLYAIYIGQDILLPFGFAFLIAVLLRPLEKFFTRLKVPQVLSILIALLITFIFIFALLTLLSYQIGSLANDIPAIEKNLSHFFEESQMWISETFHFSKQQQQQVIEQARSDNMGNAKSIATGTLGFLTASLTTILLIPIYVFLFLYYRNHLLMFTIRIFGEKYSSDVTRAINEIRSVVQHYITGLLIETSCVAFLNCIGLLLVGVPYAILLGLIGAILNLVPYIGGLIAVAVTGIITLSNTGNIYKTVASIGVYLIVQVIDNNFLVPRIIGSSVKLNALFSIVAVLIGGALCGVEGMFLSLPFIAIFKVICDHVASLKPWGMLLGDANKAKWKVFKITSRPPRKNLNKAKLYVKDSRKDTTLFIVLLLFSFSLHAQVQTREYNVSYKGDNVGNMEFYQNKTGDNVYMKMVSNVEMNFIVNVKVNTEEESFFQNGKLIYSNVSRKVNGKEKVNKQTKASGDTYQTSSDGKPGSLSNKFIDYNLILLYSNEPVNVQIVYSDNFQQFLHIQKVSEHKYKIDLPDGNYNYYSFLNGICSNVEVHHTFYTIQITLKE
jgi:predicted PurR-regulated permease PerM